MQVRLDSAIAREEWNTSRGHGRPLPVILCICMTRRFLCLEAGRVFLSCFWFFLLACSAPQVPSAEAIGLNAEYFADSNWGAVRPSKGVRPGSFSARWSGYIQPLYSEEYTFYLSAEGRLPSISTSN